MYSIIANTHPFLEVANLNELIHTSTVEDMKSLSRDSIASYKVGYLALSYCGDLEDEMTLKAVAHAAITGKILLEDGLYLMVGGLVVLPEERGKGWGQKLASKVIEKPLDYPGKISGFAAKCNSQGALLLIGGGFEPYHGVYPDQTTSRQLLTMSKKPFGGS